MSVPWFEPFKDIKTSIVYTSTINPGGWVPKKALRSVYRREYPRFLRTFTQYVSKKNQSLPLDLINQSIGKHISSFWTLYCYLVPKITWSFWTSWFDTCIYCHHIHPIGRPWIRSVRGSLIPSIYCPAMRLPTIENYHCNNSLNYSKMPYCWSSGVLTYRSRPPNPGWRRSKITYVMIRLDSDKYQNFSSCLGFKLKF